VLSVSVNPARLRPYEDGVRRLAERAKQQRDAYQWRTYQVMAGQQGTIHFVSEVDDFKALAARDATPQSLVLRLLGEKDGAKLLDELLSCTQTSRYTISRDRADLSYAPERTGDPAPLGVVTLIRVRPGHQDAAEEMIRKIAEAIPKLDDPARIVTWQTVAGDLRTLWTVRPLRSLAELDQQLQPMDLLTRAFGIAEGGLIARAGHEAIEHVERSITMLRPDLSN
jgi:hypothetical protein